MAYLAALAHDAATGDAAAAQAWAGCCEAAKVTPGDAARELSANATACEGDALPAAAYPKAMAVLKAFRASDAYRQAVDDKLRLGSAMTMELGNLYTAALPAWLAAGLEDAATRGIALDDRGLLVLGYGSGDAAEAIPARVAPAWREAARAIRFHDALAGAFDLDRAQYEALHDTGTLDGIPVPTGVVIDHVGTHDDPVFQDFGIAYYRYGGHP
jgi:hydroxymethylglutaryl-CoA synthase